MSRGYKWAVGGIAAAAVAIRLLLAAAQLPYHYQADEFQIVERALRVGAGELNPGLFTWPGTLVIYLNFLAYAAYFAVLRVFGAVADAAAFADLYWRAPGPFYFLGRLLSTAFGLVAVLAAGQGARRAFGPSAGLAAAAFVAVAPAAVQASAIALPDMAAAALGATALAFAARGLNEARPRYFLAAAICLGLGAAAKYHVLLYGPAIWAVILLAKTTVRRKAALLGGTVAAAAAAFVVACPFAVIAAGDFTRDVATMIRRPGMARWAPSPQYLAGTTLPLALGWPLLLAAAAGVGALAYLRTRAALVVALAALPFLGAALVRPLPPRHLLPLVVPLAWAVGAAVHATTSPNRRRGRSAAATVWIALGALAFGVAVGHLPGAWRADTRTMAAEYFGTSVPAGTRVLVETVPPDVDGVPLHPTRDSLVRLVKYYEAKGGGSPGRYAFLAKSPAYPFGHRTYETYLAEEWLPSARPPVDVAVRVVPDDRAFFAEQAKPYGTMLAPWGEEYAAFLADRGHLRLVFAGQGRPGPTVEIYDIK
ncbi:MAG: glycosyltransferase family 39 protein [Candidatus Coatesbacteria bacterium]|nr:MAG: glycosyltransferase family 39 protein [Candidatus Coatesbacteria bacterium]